MTKVIVGFIGFVFAVTALTGCNTYKFELVGSDVVRTTVPSENLNLAIREAHQEMGSFTANDDGSSSDPSFSERGRTWNRSAGGTQSGIDRLTTSFADAEGRMISIERIHQDSQPTLVFIEYDAPNGSLDVINQLMHSLEEQGLKLDH